jgi:hypothetical protein
LLVCVEMVDYKTFFAKGFINSIESSGFAELGRSLFVGVTQILHGHIDT